MTWGRTQGVDLRRRHETRVDPSRVATNKGRKCNGLNRGAATVSSHEKPQADKASKDHQVGKQVLRYCTPARRPDEPKTCPIVVARPRPRILAPTITTKAAVPAAAPRVVEPKLCPIPLEWRTTSDFKVFPDGRWIWNPQVVGPRFPGQDHDREWNIYMDRMAKL